MLAVVLPKGSLEKQVLELFSAADLSVVRGSDRDYHAAIDDPRIDRVRFLRPQEIPTYVAEGLFEFGITGGGWVAENGGYVSPSGGRAGSNGTGESVCAGGAVPGESGCGGLPGVHG